MNRVRFPVRAAAAGLVLGALACQPVFVIGWQEWLIMICAAALLVGPVLFRFCGCARRGMGRGNGSDEKPGLG
jgi:hypothetical protein